MHHDPHKFGIGELWTGGELARALQRLTDVAKILNMEPEILERLRIPRELVQARLTIDMDDGSQKSFTAWRCRYEDARGPTKGGIRFHPEAAVDEVEALAFWMTVKCGVANLPFGGAKGAIRVEPRNLSTNELERLSRAYVRAFAHILGPDRDIAAPDVATNAKVMGWMADEYNSIVGHSEPDFITGKPVVLGGSLGREDATGRGGFILLKHLEKRLGLDKGKRRAVIQGFGNVGSHIAQLLYADGWKIIALGDLGGAIADENGLDIEALIAAKTAGNSVHDQAGQNGIKSIAPETLFSIDCELLVPSALQDQITVRNAGGIKARTILELANGPITPDADVILEKAGVRVLPDILANAGGVIVSYFEWVQNKQGYAWTLDDVRTRLAAIMEEQGDLVWKIAEEKKVSLRFAAYIVGLERVVEAIKAAA